MPPFENTDEDMLSGLYGLTLDDDDDLEEPPRRPHPVPLAGVKVQAEVHDLICEVKLSQCFHNNTHKNLECIYHFPIKDGAAICAFQALYQDGSVVQGVVKEKKAAQTEYTQAKKDGKQANLLEKVRGDVFTLKVGNLAVDAYVKITVTYVTTLETRHDSTTAFVLPTSIAPRYIPCSDKNNKEDKTTAALAPPQSTVKLFGLDVEADLFCRSTIQSISSPTHAAELRATMSGTTGRWTLHNVTMDGDLVILIHEEKPHQPRASLEVAPDGTMTGFVTFVPEIEFPDVPAKEFVFVVDRSGSMGGNKMAQTRETLLLFLRSLPATCTFNIIGFGSRFESLFPTTLMPYNDETLEAASQHVATMQANFGGTNIVAPLQHVFGSALLLGTERQVFVLTDGQVSNDEQAFDVIRQNCQGRSSRLFSVGIGESVSRHLVSGMARAGRGTSCFVEDGSPGPLRVKVLRQLKQSLQPALDDVSIEWKFPEQAKQDETESDRFPVKTLLGYRSPSIDQETKNPTSVLFYPSQNPPIFNKEKFLSYAMFPGDAAQPVGVVVKCETRDGPLSVDLPISADEVYQGSIAKKLAARVALVEFEEERKERSGYHQRSNIRGVGGLSESEALQLALSNGLASDLTSFIAVHEDTVVDAGGQIETKVIPQTSRRNSYAQGSCSVRSMLHGISMTTVSREPSPRKKQSAAPKVAQENWARNRFTPSSTWDFSRSSSGEVGDAGVRPAAETLMELIEECMDETESCSRRSSMQGSMQTVSRSSAAMAPRGMHSRSTPARQQQHPPRVVCESQPLKMFSRSSSASEQHHPPPPHEQIMPPYMSWDSGSDLPWTKNVGDLGNSIHASRLFDPQVHFHEQGNAPSTSWFAQREKEQPDLAVARVMDSEAPSFDILQRAPGYATSKRRQRSLNPAAPPFNPPVHAVSKRRSLDPVGSPVHFHAQGNTVSEDLSHRWTQKRSSNLPPTDLVLRICLQQNANGEFAWNDNLVSTLGLKHQQVKQLYELVGSPDQKLFGTALAIAVLRRSFATQHNVWELQEQKALQVLSSLNGLQLVTRLEDEVVKMLPRSA